MSEIRIVNGWGPGGMRGIISRKLVPGPVKFSARAGRSRTILYRFSTVPSSAERPFQAICMPMHKRMNAMTRRIPWAVD